MNATICNTMQEFGAAMSVYGLNQIEVIADVYDTGLMLMTISEARDILGIFAR
ncbi:hypothetical protein ACVBEF_18490 [Glaciimonas sp. GG7]